MKDFANLADNADELAQIRYFLSQVHGFTIDYLFALRKVLPTLKVEYKNLSKEERAALVSYISKLDMRMTAIFFNSLKFIEPISAHLIGEELELYDAMMKEIAEGMDGDEWKNAGPLKNPLKSDSATDMGETARKELEQLMQSLSSKKKLSPNASDGKSEASEKNEEDKPKKGRGKKSTKMDDKAKEGFLKKLGESFMEGFNAAQETEKKKPRRRKKSDDDKKED